MLIFMEGWARSQPEDMGNLILMSICIIMIEAHDSVERMRLCTVVRYETQQSVIGKPNMRVCVLTFVNHQQSNPRHIEKSVYQSIKEYLT